MKRLVLLLALTTTIAAQPELQRRNFTRMPPVVKRAALRLLDDGRSAVLLVEFTRTRSAPRQLTITLEREKVVLRDDGVRPDARAGDRIHSATVPVDPQQLERMQRNTLGARELPLFVGRELVATVRPERVTDLRSLKDLPPIPSRADPIDIPRDRVLKLPFEAEFKPGKLIPITTVVDPSSVNAEKSLLITDPNVINDPERTFNRCTNTGNASGRWTFNHLMTEMAPPGMEPGDFVQRWLGHWIAAPNVNGQTIQPRADMVQVLGAWPKINGKLDLKRAPFKLVAIVNRIDLRGNLIYGGGSAGEARFVFALTGQNCAPQPFLVIFEYGITKKNCSAVKAWGRQWFDLRQHPIGSAAYNAALEAITVQFTNKGSNPTQVPNRSSLNQLRTNEIALASPWELREFRLGDDGRLRQDTVKQTPADGFNRQQIVATYAIANAALVLQDKHVVPDTFNNQNFLGGATTAPTANVHWDGPVPQPSSAFNGHPNLRHHFSLNTCNACHGGETRTRFTHISETGQLSGFLTGISVPDPAGEGVTRSFNDLQQRQQSLASLLSQPCFFQLLFDPLGMTH